jgi:hypothetical protein
MRSIVLCGAICTIAVGCSKCTAEKEAPTPTGPNGSGAIFDKLPLDAPESRLRTALAALAGFDEKESWLLVICADQTWIDVLDLEDEVFAERPSGHRTIRRCTLPDAGSRRSSLLRSARVDLVDDRAVSASWSFAAADFDARRKELESRLGAGEEMRLEERSAVGELQRSAVVWRFKGESWALIRGLETRVVRQNTEALVGLPKETATPARGDKISLDDIGLGGGLDLNMAIPDLAEIIPKDSGI